MGGFSPTSPDWAACDYARVTGPVVLREEVEAHIPLNVGGLSLCFYDGFVRLRLGEQRGFDYGILHKLGPALKLAVQPLENGSLIKGADIEFEITHDPFTFEFRHQGRVVQRTPGDGHFVRQYRQPPLARLDNGWFLNLELQSSEPVYGLGENEAQVPVIILTQKVLEQKMNDAIAAIEGLDAINGKVTRIRVEQL